MLQRKITKRRISKQTLDTQRNKLLQTRAGKNLGFFGIFFRFLGFFSFLGFLRFFLVFFRF